MSDLIYEDIIPPERHENSDEKKKKKEEEEEEEEEGPEPLEPIQSRVEIPQDATFSLYIGNLDWVSENIFFLQLSQWVTDVEIENMCRKFGKILYLKFLEEKSNGKSKGWCLVRFGNVEAAVRCKQAINGKQLNGKPCYVVFSKVNYINNQIITNFTERKRQPQGNPGYPPQPQQFPPKGRMPPPPGSNFPPPRMPYPPPHNPGYDRPPHPGRGYPPPRGAPPPRYAPQPIPPPHHHQYPQARYPPQQPRYDGRDYQRSGYKRKRDDQAYYEQESDRPYKRERR